MTLNDTSHTLRIAYTIQNVGGLDLSCDIGDAVPVKHTLHGLYRAGHKVSCIMFHKQYVVQVDDILHLDNRLELPTGITGTKLFKLIERAIRKLQQVIRIPYFAFFDSYRFYQACRAVFPQYDLCHEHNGLFSMGTALAAKHISKPYVLTFSADPLLERELLGNPLRGIHRTVAVQEAMFTYRQACAIICVSDAAKRHLITEWRVPAEKITVMPNGVDTDLFGAPYDAAAIRAEFGLGDAPVVGFVGGFQKWHGIEGPAEAFARVKKVVPGAKLLLVGDGPAREAVDAALVRFGVADDTIITGFLPQSRVPHLLSAIDVAVIPYPKLPQELWFSPLKLYEYMAAGRAIVAADDGQIAQVIESEKTGILFEPGNIGAMAAAIIRVLKNDALRTSLGQAAQVQAQRRHSWRQYIENLENLYRQVLNEN